MPYHWDDRRRYNADCSRLEKTYERLLRYTSAALNEHHGTDHSVRYWRVLVGPWLYMFTNVLFDRWTMVHETDAFDIEETLLLETPLSDLIPSALSGLLFQDVEWNHYVFGRAIEHQCRISCQRVPAKEHRSVNSGALRRPSLRRAARVAVRDAVCASLAMFTRNDEAMVIRSFLPRSTELRLQLTLGQLPKLWTVPHMESVPPDLSLRRRFTITSDERDPFVQFATLLISDLIPTAYLEGYQQLRRASERLPWPSRPRVIFTSNLFLNCEVFQEWAAAKSEAGHPLVIGQHGGLAGVGQYVQGEDHQVGIADRYLTWGWKDSRRQLYPAAILTNIGKPLDTWNPSGNLLLVTVPIQLFSFRSMSCPVGSNQSARFVKEQIQYAEALEEPPLSKLTVRIQEDRDRIMGTAYIDRWKRAVPGVEIDPSTTPIERRLRRCRLFVYTYNSTGFLETLARNIPTVMFWDPWYFELRTDAQPYFDALAEAGVFHETPESAAHHTNQVWDDVSEWWYRPVVQKARRVFCEQYARMPTNPHRVLKEALLTVPIRR